jgi:DNA-binding HxlR family transcriptional regulator
VIETYPKKVSELSEDRRYIFAKHAIHFDIVKQLYDVMSFLIIKSLNPEALLTRTLKKVLPTITYTLEEGTKFDSEIKEVYGVTLKEILEELTQDGISHKEILNHIEHVPL